MPKSRLYVQANTVEATVNSILREWRNLWPGGLREDEYSTLNLMALCRQGPLGYNVARCQDCRNTEWFASSCGNRHCPNCLGPRQAQWSEKVCNRLPNCPHFHVVFTVPEELHDFFKINDVIAANELFAAASETLKLFQHNNWKIDGGFLGVLHTWGRALNWHPHLHVLVSAGGRDIATGRWRQARDNYLFPVKSMSKVFRAIFLRRIEQRDAVLQVQWPESLKSIEARRTWRANLAGKNWNIFSRATLGNTRAVVRYLARYTNRIAINNQRIKRVDEQARTVSFEWKDYKDGETTKEMTMPRATFLKCFAQHLVPKGFRRVRYFGLLAGGGGYQSLAGAPVAPIGEKAPKNTRPTCQKCGGHNWRCKRIPRQRIPNGPFGISESVRRVVKTLISQGKNRFSLFPQDSS